MIAASDASESSPARPGGGRPLDDLVDDRSAADHPARHRLRIQHAGLAVQQIQAAEVRHQVGQRRRGERVTQDDRRVPVEGRGRRLVDHVRPGVVQHRLAATLLRDAGALDRIGLDVVGGRVAGQDAEIALHVDVSPGISRGALREPRVEGVGERLREDRRAERAEMGIVRARHRLAGALLCFLERCEQIDQVQPGSRAQGRPELLAPGRRARLARVVGRKRLRIRRALVRCHNEQEAPPGLRHGVGQFLHAGHRLPDAELRIALVRDVVAEVQPAVLAGQDVRVLDRAGACVP